MPDEYPEPNAVEEASAEQLHVWIVTLPTAQTDGERALLRRMFDRLNQEMPHGR